MGSLYALSTMIGDHEYAAGMKPQGAVDSIAHMRMAGQFNPFDPQNRAASARIIAISALSSGEKAWLNAARPELIKAIQTDYSSADLLLKLITIDLKLENYSEAQFVYDQFKRVDRKSPLIALVDQQHQQQAAPSPANP